MGVAGSIGGVLQRRRRGGVDYAAVAGGNVDKVKAWVQAHPAAAGAVRDAETAGKHRPTLLAWLDVAVMQHEVDSYDPHAYTVEEVVAFVGEHPEQLARIRAAEGDDGRVTLLEQLDAMAPTGDAQ